MKGSIAGRSQLPTAMLVLTLLLTSVSFGLLSSQPTHSLLIQIWSEWTVWLVILHAAGAAMLLMLLGRPSGIFAWAVLALCNAWLLSMAWLSHHGELLAFLHTALDSGVRLLLASLWMTVVAGSAAIVTRLISGPAGWWRGRTWVRFWLAATLFVGCLEAGMRALDRIPRQESSQTLVPPEWSPAPSRQLHIAALGGSTMNGAPYTPRIDIPTVFAAAVQSQLSGRHCLVTNLAGNGLSFRQSALRLKELPIRPDIILVYTGHNEFFHDLESSALQAQSTLPALDGYFAWSAAYRRISSIPPLLRGPGSQTYVRPGAILRRPLFSEQELSERLNGFRCQLESIARFCHREGIRTVWFVPASSEGVFEPNRSVERRLWRSRREARIQDRFAVAAAFESNGEWEAAAQVYRSLSDEFSGAADLHFRYGECLAELGQYESAAAAFRRAVDLDGQPAQAGSAYRTAIREIAERHRIPLVDAAQVLRPLTPHGILDRSVIHDNVHPVLQGHFALGLAACNLPEVRRWLGISGADAELDFEQFLSERKIDAAFLATAYERTAWCLETLGDLRSDPSRRSSEATQYRRWADDLRDGTIRPGEAGTEFLSNDSRPGVRFPSPTEELAQGRMRSRSSGVGIRQVSR
jgi:tetratricopeptide (TPR) repeat protein